MVTIVASAGALKGPYSNSTKTQSQSITASSSDSCTACSASVGILDVKWNPKVYYYTAATVIISSDNTTNATRTSTLAGPAFVIPPNLQGIAQPVNGSVLSTQIAGTAYSLTYPTPYSGLASVQVTEQFLYTDNAGHITCTSSSSTLSYQYLSTPQETGIAGVKQGCKVEAESPPIVLLCISYVTATSTRSASAIAVLATALPYVAAQPVLPAPAFKVTPTSGSVTSTPASTATKTLTSSRSSGSSNPTPGAKSISGVLVAGGNSNPPPPPSPPSNPSSPSTAQPFGGNAITESGILLAQSFPVLAPPSPTPTSQPLLTTPKPAALPPISPTAPISTLPLLPGAPAITLAGTTYSLSPSPTPALILNKTQTLLPGSPPVTIAGTPYALASPATALLIGSSGPNSTSTGTSTLPFAPLPPAVITTGSSGTAQESPLAFETLGVILVPAGTNAYLVNWKPLLPGGTPVTVNGQTVSLQPNGTGVVVGGETVTVAPGAGVTGLGGALGSAGLKATGGGAGEGFTGEAGRVEGRGRGVVLGTVLVPLILMVVWF